MRPLTFGSVSPASMILLLFFVAIMFALAPRRVIMFGVRAAIVMWALGLGS